MKKILFLPLLNISSGHQQAADALIEIIHRIDPSIYCEKVDLLQYSYGRLEKLISAFYLKWIHFSPNTYNWLYEKFVCSSNRQQKRFRLYVLLFQSSLIKLLIEKQPDLIVCTHALPSFMMKCIHEMGTVRIPVINVYTDFFINNMWDLTMTDYHFVPDLFFKKWLMSHKVQEKQIFVTGIPVHPDLLKKTIKTKNTKLTCLITGGSLGSGSIKKFIMNIAALPSNEVHYIVLCGKNEKLFRYLENQALPSITPLRYVHSRKKMNQLYDRVDAVITKPGGITISESLYKSKPILIYHALPGQEQKNLAFLLKHGLALHLKSNHPTDNLNEIISKTLQSIDTMMTLQARIKKYQHTISQFDLQQILTSIIR